MPTYTFLNKNTNEETSEFMSISEMEQFMKDNLNMEILLTNIAIDHRGIIGKKPSETLRKKLNGIDSYYKNNTVNNY